MDLRQYLDILRRHKWFVVEATVAVALLAGIISAIRTPVYEGTAKVFLRPNDPAEQVNPQDAPRQVSNDPDRYVAAQKDFVTSEAVAEAAAKLTPGSTAKAIKAAISVDQSGASDVIDISATNTDPARARDIANAVAKSYIENRRLAAVAGLESAAANLEDRLLQLQKRIADIDTRIGDGTTSQPGATATPQRPTSGTAAPGRPTSQPENPDLGLGGQPTSDESLKAARYAAAVQYEQLFSRQQELLVNIELKRGEAELISEAKTPTSPISPKPKRDAALGAFVGLLLGTGIAFLREQLDDRIRSREDVETVTSLGILAELPWDDESSRTPTRLAGHERPLGGLAEAVRSLRTSIQFLGVDHALRCLVVTSPGPQDGKSTVAANLGAVYAQAGYRTVLVSADLRRPRLEAILGVTSRKGLADVIAQMDAADLEPSPIRRPLAAGPDPDHTPEALMARRERVEAALLPTMVPNLFLLPAGTTPPNASELLASRRAGEVLDDLNFLADMVIIDTPPILAVTDAAVLAAKADGVILVNSVGETRRGAAARARETLSTAQVRLLGVVLNKVTAQSSSYYTYASYYGAAEDRNAKPKRRRNDRDSPLSVPSQSPAMHPSGPGGNGAQSEVPNTKLSRAQRKAAKRVSAVRDFGPVAE